MTPAPRDIEASLREQMDSWSPEEAVKSYRTKVWASRKLMFASFFFCLSFFLLFYRPSSMLFVSIPQSFSSQQLVTHGMLEPEISRMVLYHRELKAKKELEWELIM